VAGKKLPQPMTIYFLIRELETHRFEMTAVSKERQNGCPGEAPAKSDSSSF
jgi:hypothetical protein